MDSTGARPLTDDEVAAWRRRFPILSRSIYLVNHSLGAMPATVPDALAEFAEQWASKGVTAWDDWFPEVRRVADLLAGLLGAPEGSVVVHQNVATLTAMVASALDFSGRRNGIVMTDAEWPSHRYLFAEHEGAGARVVVVPTDGVHVDTERLLAAIDERTLLVPLSHVTFRGAFINDVEAVVARAHEVGALVLVDGYHAVGHLPVDVTALGCDFYVGGSVKWLCGGPGVGFLYVRPDLLATLAPRQVGWLGHARPFAFDDAWLPADGAMGWLGGTPGVPALYATREGYRVVAEVGPERIRATSRPLTARLVEGAEELGLRVRTPLDPDRRAGTVAIDLGAATDRAALALVEQGVLVDARPDAGIRVGPHFFNTVADCDRLLEAIAPLAAG